MEDVDNTEQQVTVKPVKAFEDSATGKFITPESGSYSVTRQRAADLKANGLVEIEGEGERAAVDAAEGEPAGQNLAGEKQAPTGRNKAAPAPGNRAAPATDGKAPSEAN
jgi:hypothetical protein